MKRGYPKHYNEYLELAKEMELECPEGLALYVCNRIANGDWYYPLDSRMVGVGFAGFSERNRLKGRDRMRGIRLSTRRRWAQHWKKGGSIRCISRTQKEQNQHRRDYRRASHVQN